MAKLTLEEAKKIQEKYINKYMHNPDHPNMNMCGISSIRMKLDEMAQGGQQFVLNKSSDHMKSTDKPSDFCLSVGLEYEHTNDDKLPKRFSGMRVFYEIIGKIVAQ